MVDFQSRDTRRGIGGRDDEDEESDDAEETGTQDDPEQQQTSAETDDPEQQQTNESSDAAQSESVADTGGSETEAQTDTVSATEASEPAETASRSDQPAATKSVPTETETAQNTAASGITVDVAVVTVGTAREGTDPTGDRLVESFEAAGHSVSARERLRGEYDSIQQSVDTLVGRNDVDVVVTAGGTGINPDEATIEAVHPLLEKALPGFGEAFRTLLFEHIGTGIVAVRSTAGIADGTPVFCLPGDEQAAVLAIEEIIATEAGELVEHLQ